MGQFSSLINAAYKAIDNTYTLLENDNIPFNAVYKQYKILQSFWFRVVEEASDYNSKQLEELCVDLEEAVQCCDKWIKSNSPTKPQQNASKEIKEESE